MKYRSITTIHKKLCHILAILVICAALPLFIPQAEAAEGGNGNNGGGNSGGNNGGGNSGGGNSGGGGTTIGFSSGSTEYYHLSSLTLSDELTIDGPVVMVIDGDFTVGNNLLTISPNGSLMLYLGGSLTMNGQGGLNNEGIPANAIIYGTHPDPGTESDPEDFEITLNGNSGISAVVYAPYADYTSNGGGNSGATLGAVIAQNITFNGNPGPFLYDEALKDLQSIFESYNLENYKLMKNGLTAPSEAMAEIVDSNNYDVLFSSLFDD